MFEDMGIENPFNYQLDFESFLQDPHIIAKKECKSSGECDKFRALVDKCADRINNATEFTDETCNEEMIDYVQCIDECVSVAFLCISLAFL